MLLLATRTGCEDTICARRGQLLQLEVRANVEAIDFGALAIHDGELRPLQFEFLADDPSDAVEARALCFARKYNLEAECGDDDRQRCVAASIAAAARSAA